MNQSFGYNAGRYSTNSDYFGNLDIVRGQYGYDSTYAYFATDMFSTKLENASGGSADEGLKYHYRIRVSLDSSGAGGFLFSTDTPYDFGSTWHTEKNFVYRDTNGDLAVDGNGYDLPIVSDGLLSGTEVFWTRLRPGDASVVEFAINLESFGFTASQLANLPYLVFEANKGLLDPQNYLWNKEYNPSEAGSPNGGPGGLSEFGTQGLGNIYELDTLRAGAIPEPSSALLFCMGSIGLFYRRRNRSSQGG
jgi:PEP-CTERM motif